MATPSTPPSPATVIVLKGDLARRKEGRVGTGLTIYPGMLVEQLTTTPYPYQDYKVHGTANGRTTMIFAEEQRFAPDIPFGSVFKAQDINTPYNEGELMFLHICSPGDVIYAFMAANAAAVDLSSALASNGDGTFKKWTTGDKLARPLEVVDNHNIGTRTRIRIEII